MANKDGDGREAPGHNPGAGRRLRTRLSKRAPGRSHAIRSGSRGVGVAVVGYDVRTGVASIEVRSPRSQLPPTSVEVASDRLVLISYYLRARRAFATDTEMAHTLGIDRTRLIAWKKGAAAPRQEHVRYLGDVATAVDTLRRFLHPAVVVDWLVSPKDQLGGDTPVDALRTGRLADVLRAANATEHGAFG